MRLLSVTKPVLAAILTLAPGAMAAEGPPIHIIDSEIRLTERLSRSVPVVENRLLQSLRADEAPVSNRMLTLGRRQTNELDLQNFSHLIDMTPGSSLQRAIGKEWIVTLAGSDLYMEKRTDTDIVSRVAVRELWERLLTGASQEVLKSPSLNYDQVQDRWTVTGAYDRSTVVSAVSESGDPTGSWRVYRVVPKDDLLSVNPVLSLTGGGEPVLSVSWLRRDDVVDPVVPEPTTYPLLESAGPIRAALPQPASISPSSGTGMTSAFFANYSDLDGASTISFTGVLINSTLNGMNGCVIYYDGAGLLGLVNDANTSTTWGTPNNSSSPPISNSQCTLRMASSYIQISGTSLTLRLDLTFNANFGGTKALYMYARDASGDSSWQVKGYWAVPTVAPAPVPRPITSGVGSINTFSIFYDAAAGGASVTFAGLLLNSGLNGTNGCVVYYAGGNKLGLVNDANTNTTYITVGTADVVSNSQCTLNATGSSIYLDLPNQLNIGANLTFKQAFGGVKSVYGYARTSSAESGWRLIGSWGVPSSNTPPQLQYINPSSGSGDNQQFQVRYDTTISAPVAVAGLLVNSALGGVNSCVVYFDVATNQIGLVNDTNSVTNYIAPQTVATVSNSQCTLNGSGSYLTVGTPFTNVYVSLTFKPIFRGTKTVYAYVRDTSGQSTGWVAGGNWTVVGGSIAPRPDFVSPTAGAGASQTFDTYFTSPSGASAVTTAGLLVNATLSGVNNCVVYYSGGNQLCLANNANTAATCVTVGVNADVSNSQCTLRGASSSISVDGTTFRISPSLQFFPAFNGAKNTYGYGCVGSLCSGWQQIGSWTVQ